VEKPPKKSVGRELMARTVEGAVGMVPVVGSPLAVAFATAVGWSSNRRMDQWLDELASAITDLQDRTEGLSFDDLAGREDFLDATVAATRAAQATSSQEKLAALRNGVLNVISPDAPVADEQARFFRLVDEFTPAHLAVLKAADDPQQLFERRSLRPIGMDMVIPALTRADAICSLVPELSSRPDWYALIERDLVSASLIREELRRPGGRVWESVTTPLGKRFLAFISAPE
jgi:hypothetical protein